MKNIAVFFDRQYIEAHFCFKELIIHLAKEGHAVTLFHVNTGKVPSFDPELNIRKISFSMSKKGTLKLLLRLLAGNFKYDLLIANPQWPLYMAYKMKMPGGYKMICLADEVLGAKETDFSIYQRYHQKDPLKWKEREIEAHQNCSATVALGEERYQLSKQINMLSNDHTYFIIPNAPSGNTAIDKGKQEYYSKKFNLKDSDLTIIHAGGLQWGMINELDKLKFSDPNIKIILQNRLKERERTFASKHIILSEDFIDYADMVSVTSGAKIALMLYDENNPEEKRNGNTSGKLGLYLAAGLPIIGCNLNVFEWLDKEGCGIRINNLSELEQTVKKIMANYQDYCNNSRRIFNEKYEYSTQFKPFAAWITEQ